MRLNQRLTQRAAQRFLVSLQPLARLSRITVQPKYPPRQRIAVGVQPARRKTTYEVARGNLLAQHHAVAFYRAHYEAGHVELARLVDARKLRSLATDESARRGPARFGYAIHNFCNLFRYDLRGRDVVQEEDRSRSACQDVVHTMVDDVNPGVAVRPQERGELQLRADPVSAGDQHLRAIPESVQASEVTHVGQHLRAERAAHRGPD